MLRIKIRKIKMIKTGNKIQRMAKIKRTSQRKKTKTRALKNHKKAQ